MKTAKELLDERLKIQNGFHKGARVTITEAMCKELMEDYHEQFYVSDEEIKIFLGINKLNYDLNYVSFGGAKWMRDLIFKK
jgi:hypothetical protein